MVWILALFSIGYNFTFWVIIGLIRLVFEKIEAPKKNLEQRFGSLPISFSEVAAIIPAHNEEKSIRPTIQALLEVLPPRNIYVVSDYSTDATVEIVRSMGVRSLDLSPNKGKAKALTYIMNEYGLLKAYKAIIINDADCILNPNYLTSALQYFRDEGVAAVSPHGNTRWSKGKLSELFFTAYRARLWRITQLGLRFGQTWKFTNVSYIIPGAFSIYRTSVLEQLEIDAPGLVIEDFNMTFEVQRKHLGRIVYSPKISATHQDPHNLDDYVRQLRRWNVGFWQTVKRHGIWPSFFWLTTGAFLIEMTLYTLFFLMLPLVITLLALNSWEPVTVPLLDRRVSILDLFLGIFVADYLITVIAAVIEKKPIMLLLGLGFIILRFVDAIIYFISIPQAFLQKSEGTWVSPKRL